MQISVKLTTDLPYGVSDPSSATLRLVYDYLRMQSFGFALPVHTSLSDV